MTTPLPLKPRLGGHALTPTRVSVTLPDSPAVRQAMRALGGAGGSNVIGWLPSLSEGLSDAEELDDPYRRIAWITAAIDLLCVAVSSAPLRIWDRDPMADGAVEVTSGPAFELFQRVNEVMTPSLLSITDALNISLSGESFWFLLDRNRQPVGMIGDGRDAILDLPEEIVPLRGTRVRLDNAPGHPPRWQITDSHGRTRDWPLGGVVQLMEMPHPAHPLRGIGRIEKAWGPAHQSFLADRYQNFILANNGAPAALWEIEGYLNPDEQRFAEEQLRDFDDPANAGRDRVVPKGLHRVADRQRPRDMEWSMLKDKNKEDIGAVMMTPGALLGQQAENFATFGGHWRTYIQLRVLPYLRLQADAINRQFFARLRDVRMRKYRVAYDDTDLRLAFRDLEETGQAMLTLRRAGVPMRDAALATGITMDERDGDDVSLVEPDLLPLGISILKHRADAALRLTEVGYERKAAAEMAGLPTEGLKEEEDPPDMEPEAADDETEGDPVEDEPDDDVEEPVDEGAEADKLLVAARRAFETRGERVLAWREFERQGEPHRRKLTKAVRSVFYAMRRAQLRALEQYAAEGRVDRAAVYGFRGCPLRKRAPGAPRPVWPGNAARVPAGLAARLLEADAEGSADAFLRRHPWLVPALDIDPIVAALFDFDPGERVLDDVLAARYTLSEDELQALLVVNDAAWVEALEAKVAPILQATFESMAAAAATAFDVPLIDLAASEVLRELAARAPALAEGTTSVIARRMRSDLIRVLSGQGDFVTLREAIEASLRELKAATTRAFNSHSARALAISRTEVGIASNAARDAEFREAYQRGLSKGNRWSTAQDGNVRDSHQIDGQLRIPDQPFELANGVRLRYPQDPQGPPGDVIACRCTAVPEIVDDAEDDTAP